MKRSLIMVLCLVLALFLTACGKSQQAKEADEKIAAIGQVTLESEEAIKAAESAVEALEAKDKESLENLTVLGEARNEYDRLVEEKIAAEKEAARQALIDELTSVVWVGVLDGDAYTFNADGTGSHEAIQLTYTVEDGVIYVIEGAAGLDKKQMELVDENGARHLVPQGEDVYYMTEEEYEVLSQAIRAEYTAVLTSHEAWAIKKNGAFVGYYMFSENGGGWIVTTGGTLGMTWEFADNDTLKLYSNNYSAMYDIEVENGDYKLYSTSDRSMVGTPHN